MTSDGLGPRLAAMEANAGGGGAVAEPRRIAGATSDKPANLLIALIRKSRFWENDLNSAFEIGVLTAIVKRTEALLGALAP